MSAKLFTKGPWHYRPSSTPNGIDGHVNFVEILSEDGKPINTGRPNYELVANAIVQCEATNMLDILQNTIDYIEKYGLEKLYPTDTRVLKVKIEESIIRATKI